MRQHLYHAILGQTPEDDVRHRAYCQHLAIWPEAHSAGTTIEWQFFQKQGSRVAPHRVAGHVQELNTISLVGHGQRAGIRTQIEGHAVSKSCSQAELEQATTVCQAPDGDLAVAKMRGEKLAVRNC